MDKQNHIHYLPELASREHYVEYLEGYSPVNYPSGTRNRHARLKTFMLETARSERQNRLLQHSFPADIQLVNIDESLFKVKDSSHDGNIVGLVEVFNERHPVFYTFLESYASKAWVKKNVDQAPWLDRMWLSSHILYNIWEHIRLTVDAKRYVGLGFDHESKYEMPTDPIDYDNDDYSEEMEDEDNAPVTDRRKSRVYITERLGILDKKFKQFSELYDPFHSLVQLQIPADNQGGHRLNFDGQATNLSDSFVEHRARIISIVDLYQKLTESAEDQLWLGTEDVDGGGFRLDGEPIFIQFAQELSEETFHKFITYGFQRRNSISRIGGYIHQRGPKRIHLSAIDRHLWQPFILEATTKHILMLLPRGTCGNTIHRLVTYVQRYVSPKIDVWLGDELYQDAVKTAQQGRII